MTGRWGLLAWAAALALGLRALHALGAGSLGVPLASAEGLSAWIDRTPPEVMAVALVRLVALAAGWYLAVCTLALALTRPFGRTRVASLAGRATPALVRRLVSGGGGLGLAAGTIVGALPSADLAPAALAPRPAAASTVDGTQDPAAPTATMTRQQPTPAAATMTSNAHDVPSAIMSHLPTTDAAPPSRAPPAGPAPDPAPAAAPSSWTVEAGDSFWSIAADTVGTAWEAPTDPQVVGYWRRLIDANRSGLLDPGNPDLLVPGQELVLPDPVRTGRGTDGSGVGAAPGT